MLILHLRERNLLCFLLELVQQVSLSDKARLHSHVAIILHFVSLLLIFTFFFLVMIFSHSSTS